MVGSARTAASRLRASLLLRVDLVGVDGSLVREFKHSSVRIEYPLPALYMGTEYFIPAGTFKTARRGY